MTIDNPPSGAHPSLVQLTIEEAATRSGKSERQIRYLIKLGRLTAHKAAGRWLMQSEQVDQVAGSPRRQKAAARKQAKLREVVEDTLPAQPKGRRYSLRDLKAMQVGVPLYQQLCTTLGEAHPAVTALRQGLAWLARGCHRYDLDQKLDAYQRGRDEISLAACALVLDQASAPALLAALCTIEDELLPAVAGLLRRIDNRGAAAPPATAGKRSPPPRAAAAS